MSGCGAELCAYWTGQGCACDVMGIEKPARPECTCAQDPWACCDLHDALRTVHMVPVDESEDGW